MVRLSEDHTTVPTVTLPCAVEPPEGEEPVLPAVVPIRASAHPGHGSASKVAPSSNDDDFKGIIPRAVEREQMAAESGSKERPRNTTNSHGEESQRGSRRGRSTRLARDSNHDSVKSASHSTQSWGSDDFRKNEAYKRFTEQPQKAVPRRCCCCECVLLFQLYDKAVPVCRFVNKNGKFQFIMFMALLFALFLPDVWILANRPTNSDLDIILTLVLGMFLFELFVQLIGTTRTYANSFFFYTDILGAVSVLLDLHYVGGGMLGLDGAQVSQNSVVMRAARVAKLGARAGRFTKLVKLLRFLPGMRDLGTDQGTAKVISGRLNFALSMRVSCLIIVLVMVLPLFSMWTYPEQDWSMRSFMAVLDKAASPQNNASARFMWQLQEFGTFYEDKIYYPYRLSARSDSLSSDVLAQLPWESSRGPPARKANALIYEADHLRCEFNFERPNQTDALLSTILLVIVMLLMVGFSVLLSNSVSAIVLRPLEKLLNQVRNMAATIFQSVNEMGEEEDDSREEQDEKLQEDTVNVLGTEVDLLERVVAKLGAISNIRVNKTEGERDNLAGLGDFDRAVIHGFQGGSVHNPLLDGENKDPGVITEEEELRSHDGDSGGDLSAQQAMVTNTGLSLELLDSWNLNPLELDKARNHAAMMYFVGPHNHGIAFDSATMVSFLQSVEAGYLKTSPYHNWFHAIDATHGVYRLMQLFIADAFMSNLERFGLLISAVCHDIGHPGLNNSFLVETSHELALRYNDKSPLENMHCARLFEFVTMPKCNIFANLSKAQFHEIRKVCIEAILHTDNAQHFSMIKEVQMIYEVNSEILDIGRECYFADSREFPTREATETYRQPDTRKLLLKLVLHVADVSNSTKPFRICRIWASQVLEEFFMQGDKEKKQGVPVQALNDREKVNRAFSQIGFIEFLVSPLLFAVVKVLPPIEPQVEQMIQNVKTWHSQWLESSPPPSEAEKKALEVRIAKLDTKYRDCL